MKLLIASLLLCCTAFAQGVTLTWGAPPTGTTFTTYYVVRGTAQHGPFTTVTQAAPSVLTYTDTAVLENTYYFYYVLAYNGTQRVVSSNEIRCGVATQNIGLACITGSGPASMTATSNTQNFTEILIGPALAVK